MAAMPSFLQRSRAAQGKRARAPAASSGPAAAPYLRFYHSASLRKKTLSVLDALERAPNPVRHRDALADVVVELTQSGLDYFFMQPLKRAGTGFILQQSAKLGMAGTEQVMGSVVRNVIGRMDGPQLLSVCDYIRKLMT